MGVCAMTYRADMCTCICALCCAQERAWNYLSCAVFAAGLQAPQKLRSCFALHRARSPEALHVQVTKCTRQACALQELARIANEKQRSRPELSFSRLYLSSRPVLQANLPHQVARAWSACPFWLAGQDFWLHL